MALYWRRVKTQMNSVGLSLGLRKRRVGTLVLAAMLLLGAWAHAWHLIASVPGPEDCLASGKLAHVGYDDTTSDSAPCHDFAHCEHCKALASSSGLETSAYSLQLAEAPSARFAQFALSFASIHTSTHLTRGPPAL